MTIVLTRLQTAKTKCIPSDLGPLHPCQVCVDKSLECKEKDSNSGVIRERGSVERTEMEGQHAIHDLVLVRQENAILEQRCANVEQENADLFQEVNALRRALEQAQAQVAQYQLQHTGHGQYQPIPVGYQLLPIGQPQYILGQQQPPMGQRLPPSNQKNCSDQRNLPYEP